MQRIHFEKLTSWLNVLLIIGALISIGCGIWGLSNPKFDFRWINYINLFGYLLLVFFFGKMFIRKNYVGWNKFNMFIRIKSFFGKTIRFTDVKEAIHENDLIHIINKDGNKAQIDIKNIDKADADKLVSLINSFASNS